MKTKLDPRCSMLAAILVAFTQFSTLTLQPASAQFPLPDSFNPGAGSGYHEVYSLAVQADGKILVGGDFTTLGGQPCTNIARLNVDGTLDSGFNPEADNTVYSLAMQADGKVLAGGYFTTLARQPRTNIGPLNNSAPATQSLCCDSSTITWLRGGTSPEVWRTTFDYSTNDLTWTSLGAGTRIPGGWQLTGLALPSNTILRARGCVTGGHQNASGWFVESTLLVMGISLSLSRNGSNLVLNWTGGLGPYQVQQTPSLVLPTSGRTWARR